MKKEISFSQISIPDEGTPRARWMVVENNGSILALLGDLLETFGTAEVCRFQSGAEALKAFNVAPLEFQFVVTDLDMPGMDGIELCRRLHAVSPGLKILLTTGCRIITQVEAMQTRFCGLLPKPFPAGALRQAVETSGALNGRHCKRNN